MLAPKSYTGSFVHLSFYPYQNSLVPRGHQRLLLWALTHAVPTTGNALPHHLSFSTNSHSAFGTQSKNHFHRKALLEHLFGLCICTSIYSITCVTKCLFNVCHGTQLSEDRDFDGVHSPLNTQCLEQCPPHSRCSINITE